MGIAAKPPKLLRAPRLKFPTAVRAMQGMLILAAARRQRMITNLFAKQPGPIRATGLHIQTNLIVIIKKGRPAVQFTAVLILNLGVALIVFLHARIVRDLILMLLFAMLKLEDVQILRLKTVLYAMPTLPILAACLPTMMEPAIAAAIKVSAL